MYEDIALEIAITERLALQAARERIASQQLGEAWVGLAGEAGFEPTITVLETAALPG